MKITRLFDFAYYQLETHNLDAALVSKKNGGWVKTSTKSYLNKANSFSRAGLGVKNDKIAVISSTNRTECVLLMEYYKLGHKTYQSTISDDYEYVLNHSQATYCFVSDEDVFQKVKSKSNTKLKEFSFDKMKIVKT